MLPLLLAGVLFASPAYYPEDARRRGEQGVTYTEVEADTTGKPLMCRVVGPSGSAQLDAAACEVIYARMHYAPGVGADGRPTTVHQQTIRWQLKGDPEEQHRARAHGVVAVTFLAGFLIYLPMSLLNALQSGDFWPFEKRSRFSLLRVAGRAQSPRAYWLAIGSRAGAIVLLSWVMAALLAGMAQPAVQLATAGG